MFSKPTLSDDYDQARLRGLQATPGGQGHQRQDGGGAVRGKDEEN